MSIDFALGIPSRYFDGNQDYVFDFVGAIAELAGAPQVAAASNFAAGIFYFPQAVSGIASMADKTYTCAEVFWRESSLFEKEKAIRDSVISGVDTTYAVLSCGKFLKEANVFTGTNVGVDYTLNILKIFAAVNGIVNNTMNLIEIGGREASAEATQYQWNVDEISRWQSISELVKDSTILVAGILGTAALVAGVALSSWIVLAISGLLLVSSVLIFCFKDQLERYQDDYVIQFIQEKQTMER